MQPARCADRRLRRADRQACDGAWPSPRGAALGDMGVPARKPARRSLDRRADRCTRLGASGSSTAAFGAAVRIAASNTRRRPQRCRPRVRTWTGVAHRARVRPAKCAAGASLDGLPAEAREAFPRPWHRADRVPCRADGAAAFPSVGLAAVRSFACCGDGWRCGGLLQRACVRPRAQRGGCRWARRVA